MARKKIKTHRTAPGPSGPPQQQQPDQAARQEQLIKLDYYMLCIWSSMQLLSHTNCSCNFSVDKLLSFRPNYLYIKPHGL